MTDKKKKSIAKKVSVSKKSPVKNEPAAKAAAKHQDDFPIAGIGASAGGLEALEGFFAHTPPDINIAFVIIQHLALDHKSIMGSLLTKHTQIKVSEIKDGMQIEPNCIYLNPPDRDVSVMNRRLYLLEPTQAHGLRLPIDYFFRSLANCAGDKSICIVLSGTGTDGTLGLRAVKGAGGMAMAQEESQARYYNMPRSAIDTGLVDFVLPVEKMGEELVKYVKHPYIEGPAKISPAKEKFENFLQKIFMLIRSSTGHDFSHYKQNTIRRRIERRMAVHQIDNLSEYVRYMQTNPGETKTLFKDFSITVTNFFRDPKAFKVLGEKIVPQLLEKRPDDSNIRVWIPGCATGEEAYSVAILFAEAMTRLKRHFSVQIFATDIDADAIERARQGVYPDSIIADVSNERLKQFFLKEENAFRVRKPIREMVVFATQNLIKDAPFSRLDLVCCRNVLIYMDTFLQKKILPLFHYTLNPDGFLFLGTSESVGEYSDLFSPVDFKWKIFKRKQALIEPVLPRPVTPFSDTGDGAPARLVEPSAANIRQIAERTILQNYAPPCVLVDDKFNILYFHGETDRYLRLPEGEPSFNILKMAPEDLQYKLGVLLHKAVREKVMVISKGLKIRHNNEVITINLVLKPLLEPAGKGKFTMVMFEDVSDKAKAGAKEKEILIRKADPRIAALEQELQSTKEYLQTTVEELETSNEELKSTNEELQSTNEELQSTNEELETSREELQSTNEELTTVNTELQGKLDELSTANNDLSNILASARIGTIFLDNNLNIKRFTGSMKQFFKLIDSDVGRSIGDIVHTLKYENLSDDVHTVLHNLSPIEKEIETKDKKWVLMRVIPYRTSDNMIDGALVTFFDITQQRNDRFAVEAARNFAEGIIETVREPLVILDEKLRIISANKSFYDKFLVKRAETENKFIYEIGSRQWDIPQLRKLLEDVLPKKSVFDNCRIEHEFPTIGRKVMLLNARQVFHEGTGAKAILLAIEDVTEKS